MSSSGVYAAPAGTAIGHVHLRVADLERSIAFHEGVLGFTRPLDIEALLASGKGSSPPRRTVPAR